MDEPLPWDEYDDSNDLESKGDPYLDWLDRIAEAQTYCIKNNLAFCFYRYNPYKPKDDALGFATMDTRRRALDILRHYGLCQGFDALNKAAENLSAAFTDALEFFRQKSDYWEIVPDEYVRQEILKKFFHSWRFDTEGVFDTDRPSAEIKPCFFALFALMLIGEIYNSEAGLVEASHYELSVIHASESMGLVCIAEMLCKELEQPAKTEQEIKSEAGRKAAEARHAPTKAVKRKVMELWDEELKKENPRNKTEFAHYICRTMRLKYKTVRNNWLQGLPDKQNDDLDLPF